MDGGVDHIVRSQRRGQSLYRIAHLVGFDVADMAWRMDRLLCWPGALFFVTYTYIAYVFAMPMSWVFVLHLVLCRLSIGTLTGLVAGLDGENIRQRLGDKVSEKFAGGSFGRIRLIVLIESDWRPVLAT